MEVQHGLTKTAEKRLRHAKIELFEQVSGRLDLFDYESIATLLVVDSKTANLMYDYGITIAEKIKIGVTTEYFALTFNKSFICKAEQRSEEQMSV